MNTLDKAESIYKSANIEISFDAETKIMYCKWIGLQNKDGIMKAGGIILELLRERRITKVLNDNTEVIGPWNDAAEWTVKEWFPSMIEAGLKHFSWIISSNIFSEISAKMAMPDTEVIQSFYFYAEALHWLLSKDE